MKRKIIAILTTAVLLLICVVAVNKVSSEKPILSLNGTTVMATVQKVEDADRYIWEFRGKAGFRNIGTIRITTKSRVCETPTVWNALLDTDKDVKIKCRVRTVMRSGHKSKYSGWSNAIIRRHPKG